MCGVKAACLKMDLKATRILLSSPKELLRGLTPGSDVGQSKQVSASKGGGSGRGTDEMLQMQAEKTKHNPVEASVCTELPTRSPLEQPMCSQMMGAPTCAPAARAGAGDPRASEKLSLKNPNPLIRDNDLLGLRTFSCATEQKTNNSCLHGLPAPVPLHKVHTHLDKMAGDVQPAAHRTGGTR